MKNLVDMNWGTKIILAFTGFAAFILFMVVQAFQQDFDLVAEDYYAREINYESQLRQQANLQKLGEKVTVKQTTDRVVFTFPEGQAVEEGQVHFYHPSKKLLDRKVPVKSGKLTVDHALLVPGTYHLYIHWVAEGIDYLQKEKVLIP